MIIQNKKKADWLLVLTCMDKEGTRRLLSKMFLPALGGIILLAGITISGLFTMDIFQKGEIPAAHLQAAAPTPVNDDIQLGSPTEVIQEPATEQAVASLSEPIAIQEVKPEPIPIEVPAAQQVEDSQGIIVEQDITEDTVHQSYKNNQPISIAERMPDASDDPPPQRLRVLSGPGATIEVRRLIPEKR